MPVYENEAELRELIATALYLAPSAEDLQLRRDLALCRLPVDITPDDILDGTLLSHCRERATSTDEWQSYVGQMLSFRHQKARQLVFEDADFGVVTEHDILSDAAREKYESLSRLYNDAMQANPSRATGARAAVLAQGKLIRHERALALNVK